MPRELIVEYLDGGKRFAALARTVSTSEMDRSPISGQWSPAFIIHHLSDAELHFATRFLRILTEDKPAIQPFDEDVYPSRLNYSQRDPQLSLRSFEAVNKTMADLLSQIPEVDWERQGVHAERGEFPLIAGVKTSRNHVQAHIEQLEQVLQALKAYDAR
ncbi:MAG: DinB family protein [Actinomycetota bacterium]